MNEFSTDKITPHRALALRNVLTEKPDFLSDTTLSEFLSTYFLCEALANKLIEYFEADNPPEAAKPKKINCFFCGSENELPATKNKAHGHFKTLDVGKIKKALLYFALDFSAVEADAVFKGGNGIVGQRAARQLRNEYAHSLSPGSRKEISERAPVLLDSMTRFYAAIQSGTSN